MHVAKMIFHFDDPIEFLNSHFQEKQKLNPRFSLRAWARQMGYQNPSLLFQVLRGERRLKMDLALKLADNLGLTGKSLRYFELMVLNRACQSEPERRVFETMLAKLRPRKLKVVNNLSMDIFAATSDWYHWVILTMTEFSDFEADVNWIQKHLGSDLDKKTIKLALDRLLRLGLLSKQVDGTYKKAEIDQNPHNIIEKIPSDAIKQYHTQMIEKAKAAVEQQSADERQVTGTTLAFSKNDLPQVEQIIAEAHQQIQDLSRQSVGEEIYQLNSQFFRLTNKKKTLKNKLKTIEN